MINEFSCNLIGLQDSCSELQVACWQFTRPFLLKRRGWLARLGKNTNEKYMVEDEEEEEVVDSGDIDIHIGVNSTVVERPVCRRESLISDDN